MCGINGLKYSYGGSRAGYSSMQTVANLQKLANVLQEQSWVRGMKVCRAREVFLSEDFLAVAADVVGVFLVDGGTSAGLIGGHHCASTWLHSL